MMYKFPITCVVESNQSFARAWLYELGKDEEGPYALIVYERGNVEVLYLNKYHSITIKDWNASKLP